MINIERERYIIIKDDTYMFCGLARQYEFKDISNIGNTAIKTYVSEKTALSSFRQSWWNAEELIESGCIKIIKIKEIITEIGE